MIYILDKSTEFISLIKYLRQYLNEIITYRSFVGWLTLLACLRYRQIRIPDYHREAVLVNRINIQQTERIRNKNSPCTVKKGFNLCA